MSIGEQLTAARLRAGMSVEELSAATRIRPGLLTAMEADDFSRCGGNFYARGHVRSVARVLAIDPEPLVAEFDEAHAAPEVSRSRRQERADARPPTVHPARPRWAVVLGAILVGLMGWGMVRLFTLPSDMEATAARSSPTPVVTSAQPKPTPTVVKPKPARPAPPRTVRITLMGARTGTYVSLRNYYGEPMFSGTLRSGASHSLTYGGAIRVSIGVPRNIKIYVNGQRVYPKVERFLVTLAGKVEKPQ